jgi:hypothetical protein
LLERELDTAENRPFIGEVEQVYQRLTDDAIPKSERMTLRRELERAGVDVESVEADFVSHTAIHTYLTEVRGADKEEDVDAVQNTRERLQRLRSRLGSVAEDQVETLRSSGHLDTPAVDVVPAVNVTCSACGSYYDVEDFLERGGCTCAGGATE